MARWIELVFWKMKLCLMSCRCCCCCCCFGYGVLLGLPCLEMFWFVIYPNAVGIFVQRVVLHGAQCRCTDDDNACLFGEINKPSTKTAFKTRCSFYEKKREEQNYYDRKRRSQHTKYSNINRIFYTKHLTWKCVNLRNRNNAARIYAV